MKNIITLFLKLPKFLYLKSVIIIKFYLFKVAKNWIILNRISTRLRPWLWRLIGCKIGKGVSIGYDVYLDVHNANLITIEDDTWIASRSLILCHKRDLSTYFKNSRYNNLGYIKKAVVLKKGCVIGMGSIIMPGVTIGEGAIIGAGSLVTKSIPAWTIAVGNPARIVKVLEEPQ